MGLVRDERGQAALAVVMLLAIVAVVIAGLRVAQDDILRIAISRSAGEAAIEAATTVIADAYADELGLRAVRPAREMAAVLTDAATRERARAEATDVSQRNGGPAIDDIAVACHDGVVDVATTVGGTQLKARFPGPACSPP